MDPKVCGKLLTHHRRAYGVDVEALRDRFPLRRSSGKGPKMGSLGTEGCGGGNRVSWCSWMFSGYMGIYRRKKYVGGRLWGPGDRRAPRGGGRAPTIVGPLSIRRPTSFSYIYSYTLKTSKGATKPLFHRRNLLYP